MAITYHAGRRLQGLSTDVTTVTNSTVSSLTDVVFDADTMTGSVTYSGNEITLTGSTSWVNAINANFQFNNTGTQTIECVAQKTGTSAWIIFGLASAKTVASSDMTTQFEYTIRSADDGRTWIRQSSGNWTQVSNTSDNVTFKITNDRTTVTYYADGSSIGTTTHGTPNATYYPMMLPAQTGTAGSYVFDYSGDIITTTTGVKPTNVQLGSRFEETDTRKIYHYANPITFEDDFSDNLGWVKTGTKQDITGGKLTFTATRETTLQEESYNLGSALSTTWVCDFDLDITTFTSGGSSTGAVWFGLSSVDGTTSGSEEVGDYMGLGLYIGTNTDIVVFNTNGNAWNTTSANICAGCGATDLFYVRMIRDGDTITINFYPTDADRTAGTNSEKNGTKTTSGVTGLQYFRVGGRAVSGSFSATLLGSIDELKIWDGVTVVPTGNVWKEEGT